MSSTWRLGLVLTAAAVLPSCGRHGHGWLHVTVHNDGLVAADVHAEAEYWSRWSWDDPLDLSVSPGQDAEFRFDFDDLSRLKVRIYRSSDGLKIFDDFWDRNELEDLDRRVTITVHP